MKRVLAFRNAFTLSTFGALLGASFVVWSCKYPSEPAKGNTPPETRLSNIPANDTVAQYINLNAFPELTVSWIGDDPDGYVTAFKFRWKDFVRGQQTSVTQWTTILNITRSGWENVIAARPSSKSIFTIYNFLATLTQANDGDLIMRIGDSLDTQRPFAVPYKTGIVQGDSIVGLDRRILQTPTTGTFIFNSPVDSNLHRFEVVSVDNNDLEDATPAVVNFWTLVSPGSVCLIDAVPPPNSLVIRYPTERFPGLRFAFRSLDPNNTNDLTFSWAVDDSTRWSPWQFDGFAYVTASSFVPIESGTHRFFVRARNRWGVISPVVSAPFTVVVPDFDDPNFPRRILVVNNNVTSGSLVPDTSAAKQFYSEVLDSAGYAGKYDIWTSQSSSQPAFRFPNTRLLGRYSTVIYVSEQSIARLPIGLRAAYALTSSKQDTLRSYLNAGGNLVFVPPVDVDVFVGDYRTWADDIFHVDLQFGVLFKNTELDFAGCSGRLGYPGIRIDGSKLPVDSLGSLRGILASPSRGFAETISLFDSRTNNPIFEGAPLGIRYLASPPTPPARRTYSIVYFGFPLYFGEKASVIQAMRKALADVNE